MKILCATGHRPDKLGGYSDAALHRLTEFAVLCISRADPDAVISGMAQGWDTAIALAAIRLGKPLITAEPFSGQARPWPPAAQPRHAWILSNAWRRHVVCEGEYAAWKMQKRNEWMVDHTDIVLALWNGSPGGTANCVRYAERQDKKVFNVWTAWKTTK